MGRQILRWHALLRLLAGSAALLGAALLLGLADLFIRFGRLGRVASWCLLTALLAATLWRVWEALHKQLNPQSVAAGLERAFPELDNRLINYLQFSKQAEKDALIEAYVRDGVPGWQSIDVKRLKNRRAENIVLGAIALLMVIFLLSALLTRGASSIAVLRVLDPFSDVAPVSLTRLVEVQPGTTSLPRGSAVELTCRVQGKSGHPVSLDIRTADGETTTYRLGRIASTGIESHAHRVPAIAGDFRYRFRAGDAPNPPWYAIAARPPLALTAVRIRVRPPPYTGATPRDYDGLGDDITIQAGARVGIAAACNTTLKSLSAAVGAGEPIALSAPSGGTNTWSGFLTVTNGQGLRLKAADIHGDTLETVCPFTLVVDRPPAIKVLAPAGRAVLSPGQVPSIDFTVTDDYAIKTVAVVRVPESLRGAANAPEAAVLARWDADHKAFKQLWIGGSDMAPPPGGRATFRIVAVDDRPEQPGIARSAPIVFGTTTLTEAIEQQEQLQAADEARLGRVVELQRTNVSLTKAYRKALDTTAADRWELTLDRQIEIRRLTRALIDSAARPLGNLEPMAKRLYVGKMADAVAQLKGIPAAVGPAKERLSAQALATQEAILRQLDYAETGASQTRVERRVDELSALLDALVRAQSGIVKDTQAYLQTGADVADAVVDRQDALAEDLTDFINACAREAGLVAGNDAIFARLLASVAEECGTRKIRESMLLAAESLDEGRPQAALPHEMTSLKHLKHIRDLFDRVEVARENTREQDMVEVLEEARRTVEKVAELHAKAMESMDVLMTQRDAADPAKQKAAEEYREILANTREAILEIPKDLHMFKELNVANDLVEDVVTRFDEIQQTPGSENTTADDVIEHAYNKQDLAEAIAGLENLGERLEDLEMWLRKSPDAIKNTVEALDKEEMAKTDLVELADQVEDIIGDLLEQDKAADEAADDGAINWELRDFEAGWDIMEGQLANESAKGKSGNERPDHSEQSGRANVGRQGMSEGETAAAEGTINEGDENIEARRTQDPTQEGHVDADGEADAQATGGGKQGSGGADQEGMAGGTKRMDSDQPGAASRLDDMARQADAMYAKASLKNVRADSLQDAAHHLRQASDAIARGDFRQVREFRKEAVMSLQKGRTELDAGVSGAWDGGSTASLVEDVIEGGPDDAPEGYRDLVAEYYKTLNETL